MTSTVSVLDNAFRESFDDPVLFAEKWLKVSLWEKQKEILQSIVTNRRVAVKSCHSSSKTFTAAIVTLWWLARYKSAIVITTAPTQNQVERVLWAEIRARIAQSDYPYPKPTLTRLDIDPQRYPKRYAIGFTTSVEHGDAGVKLQGFHADHVLVILDEAPGVDAVLWDAIKGILASGDTRVLAIGNPVISSGPFYDAFATQRTIWSTNSISAFDTPNLRGTYLKFKREDGSHAFYGNPKGKDLLTLTNEELSYNPIPYLTSRRWVKECFIEWGPTHPLFVSRVLGEFPSQSPDSLISLEWLEKAKNKPTKFLSNTKFVGGIDCAGPGDDETVLVIRDGEDIVLLKSWPNADPRGELVQALEPFKENIELNVDTIGIGYYLARHLEDLGYSVSDVNVGESANDSEHYANLKAELYWGLRMRLQANEMAGLLDDVAIAQLSSIRWKANARGQIVIESKDDMRKRGVKSPDRAEAIMLAFAPSFQHGLFSFWEEQYKTSQQQKPVVIHSDAKSLAEAQSKEAGYTDKFKDDLHDWPLQYKDPRKMDHRAPLANVQGVHGLGKVATSQQQSDKCPNCKDAFVAKYGDGIWRCNVCGENSRSWAEKQNAMQS